MASVATSIDSARVVFDDGRQTGSNPASDRATAAAAARGDRDAQEAVLELVLPRVRAIARLLVRDPADVDDAVQEACIEILKSVRGFDGRGSLPAWSARIAERHVLRHLQRRRRRWTHTRPTEHTLIDTTPAPVDEGSLGEALPRRVEDYLSELPEVQRTALVLRHCLGHSLAEIGELTGVSVSTVRGRLRLGAESLRKQVRQDKAVGAMRREDRRLLAAMGVLPLPAVGMEGPLRPEGVVSTVRQAARGRWLGVLGFGVLALTGGLVATSQFEDPPAVVESASVPALTSTAPEAIAPFETTSAAPVVITTADAAPDAAPVLESDPPESLAAGEPVPAAAPKARTGRRSARTVSEPSADEMLVAAQTALATGTRGEAIAAYRSLVKAHPGSKAARVGQVTLRELTQ